eukprot:9923695-Heterocapsa_arctica.AAC.1
MASVVHGSYSVPCTLTPDITLHISFRAAVSDGHPQRTIDVFPGLCVRIRLTDWTSTRFATSIA